MEIISKAWCLLLTLCTSQMAAGVQVSTYPDERWQARSLAEVGIANANLDALRDLVGGRGCVIRHGYLVYSWGDIGHSEDVASAVKPVISTMLLVAVQEGNGRDKDGRRLFVEAPSDTYVASGHGGKRALWVIPSLDLVVSWNDADIEDHDTNPGNPKTKCNQAARLMKEAIRN